MLRGVSKKCGKVYLLGGGPGDPELITVRAKRRLGEADLVLYDALIHPDLLTFVRPGAQLEYVGKRAGRVYERQASINARLVEAARQGLTVARLKGGDPYLFGRGSEEAEHLAAEGVPFEVVPGVPSPLAVTAYAGISLSHRDLASSIAYITATESDDKAGSAHDWSKLATATQTLVIFMGVRKLDALMHTLIANGRLASCPAMVIQSASLPSQRTVVGTVETIAELANAAGIGMPALTIVGDVVTLRERLRWYDLQPLFGKRVLVPRASQQAAAMAQLLRDAGAEPVIAPAIRIAPPTDSAALSRAVHDVSTYGWLAFTSANGVEAFFHELREQGGDGRRLGAVQVAAIGPATAAALRAQGIAPDVIAGEFVGEAVAEAILDRHGESDKPLKVLLARAEVARQALPERLRAAGAVVDVVAAYRTLPPLPDDAARLRSLILEGGVDVVTFTSSSTVEQSLAAVGDGCAEALAKLTVACIGPITRDTALARGIRVDVMAESYTTEGLIAALAQHFAANAQEHR
jgi:uroporphyrinogen III methyltransferase/synthase